MARQKRKASGFDQNHAFWPKAIELWRRGYSNAQVASVARAEGHEFNEDQLRYARTHYWNMDELPARGAKWLREAVRQATEVYPSALEQQQALFTENYEVFMAIKQRLLDYLNGTPPSDALELAQMKVLLDACARQGRLLNETNDTITVLQAKLGRLDVPHAEPEATADAADEVEQTWHA